MRKQLFCGLLLISLASCASYTLVDAAGPVNVAGGMAVTPTIAWNKVPRRADQPSYEEVWTADGELLNQLTFYSGVPEGGKLIKQRRKAEDQVPVFRAAMLAPELAEFVEGNYRVMSGSTAFVVDKLEPATFAGSQGFALNFTYVLQSDEVKRRARAIGAVKGGKLYMMIYEGTATHYFPAYLAEFEKLAASAQTSSGG